MLNRGTSKFFYHDSVGVSFVKYRQHGRDHSSWNLMGKLRAMKTRLTFTRVGVFIFLLFCHTLHRVPLVKSFNSDIKQALACHVPSPV